GWREFVRGIYWFKMPEYASENYFNHQADLPKWYWTGKTDMRCLSHTIEITRKHAYAHHIQRLMVTGNFALLLGVAPQQICDWYLAVYADAFDWVELPNTLGMVMHADGGLLGSKPYAASGKYIQRMGDYCKHCRYKVQTRTDEDSCPFNALYWDFLIRHRDQLEHNPRMKMMYRNVDRLSEEDRDRVVARAAWIKKNVDCI
ncbi:MAG: cryptochrome/photolyase family protein, partial [Pseudomonadota bacterium]